MFDRPSVIQDRRIPQRRQLVGFGWGGLIRVLAMVILAGVLPGCNRFDAAPSPTVFAVMSFTPLRSEIATPEPEATLTSAGAIATTISMDATLNSVSPDPTGWKSLPVLPVLSPQALDIYRRGLTRGNNPRAFSKVGDGEIASHWFLTIFELAPANYNLGAYADLADAIQYFAGSFGRESLAARAGFNTTRILDPRFVLNDICEADESPLECELRQQHPSFAFISLGTNQVWTPGLFEDELRQIVEICIENGVVPILATKGDNLEGDHRINAIIAGVAQEFEIPVWNFWLSLQSLPDQGLQSDGEHLTWAENDFADLEAMTHAWPVRNLSALQVLQSFMLQLRDP